MGDEYHDRELQRLRQTVHELGKDLWALRLVVAELTTRQEEARALRLTLFQEIVAIITVLAAVGSLVLQVVTR